MTAQPEAWQDEQRAQRYARQMLGFTSEQVADLLKAAGFDEIEGHSKGLQWFVQATKPSEAQ